jgi:D-3-phosphoglycerate dehydrogenase
MKVLVKEKIADSGVELLQEQFDVELGLDWDGDELEKRIGEFDGILIRSATKLTGELIDRAERLQVIGRAGTGVDNSLSRPRPSAASSWRTRPRRTRSQPPSTPSG